MRAEDFIQRFPMEGHIENGLFIERHYEHRGEGRPASGSIYFYVAPGEKTVFHRIDCDEYWIYNAGETVEIWVVTAGGGLEIRRCGVTDDAEPKIFLAAGEIFASRVSDKADDGCLVTCITVPRFRYDGSEMIEKDEMLKICPDTKKFWEKY